VALVSTLGALAACGGSDEGDGATESQFAGTWQPVDASFDIDWESSTRSYALTSAGVGGGIEVTQSGDALTVTLVGNSASRSDALPATEDGDVLSFDVPISEEMPTGMTLTANEDGTLTLGFSDSDGTWQFEKTDAIVFEE
jgi:hypothetical protein